MKCNRKLRTPGPVGFPIVVRMIDSVDSSKNRIGDPFHASLAGLGISTLTHHQAFVGTVITKDLGAIVVIGNFSSSDQPGGSIDGTDCRKYRWASCN